MKRLASRPWKRSESGFSLIEVAIATGIVGFAMISILGLVPLGLTSFKQARNNTVESQIIQALTSELDVTSFANIPNMAYPTQSYSYDAEGNTLTSTGTTTSANAIYTAKVTYQTVTTASGTTTPTFPVNLSNEAYNVEIQITNVSQPNQSHTYSVIVANKNY